jgi:hypothetical protein
MRLKVILAGMVGMAALGSASCSSSHHKANPIRTLDMSEVQQRLTQAGYNVNLSCPASEPAAKGHSFDCIVGAGTVIKVTVTDDNGNYTFARVTGSTQATTAVAPPTSTTTSKVTVRLIWNHTGKFFDETQVWYVARVTNPGDSVASVALDTRAFDATGTIVGSSQETLPNIPAHSRFDYFGYLGGGGAFDTKLTGTPVKIEISQAANAFGQAGAVLLPMLKTSEVTLRKGSEDTYTDAAYSYNLTAKVTNTTGSDVTGGVTQQVVLYDRAGRVVGGDTGSSDNVPATLQSAISYRESWTGIPAIRMAASAAYTVWPGA